MTQAVNEKPFSMVLGENGHVWKMDHPLPESVQDRIERGVLRIVGGSMHEIPVEEVVTEPVTKETIEAKRAELARLEAELAEKEVEEEEDDTPPNRTVKSSTPSPNQMARRQVKRN